MPMLVLLVPAMATMKVKVVVLQELTAIRLVMQLQVWRGVCAFAGVRAKAELPAHAAATLE